MLAMDCEVCFKSQVVPPTISKKSTMPLSAKMRPISSISWWSSPPSSSSSPVMRRPTMKSSPTRLRTSAKTSRPNRPPVLEAAAIAVGALVGARAQEAVEQVLERPLNLAAVEPAFLAAPRRGTVARDDALEVERLHGLGVGAVEGLAHPAGGDGRQPGVDVPARPAPDMGELAHEPRAQAVDAFGERLEVGNDAVVAGIEPVVVEREGVGGEGGDAAEHGEADAALGLLGMVELVALARHAGFGIAGAVAGAHHPVAEGDALQGEGLEQRVAGGCHESSPRS